MGESIDRKQIGGCQGLAMGRGAWGVIASGYAVSMWGNAIDLELDRGVVARHCVCVQ